MDSQPDTVGVRGNHSPFIVLVEYLQVLQISFDPIGSKVLSVKFPFLLTYTARASKCMCIYIVIASI